MSDRIELPQIAILSAVVAAVALILLVAGVWNYMESGMSVSTQTGVRKKRKPNTL